MISAVENGTWRSGVWMCVPCLLTAEYTIGFLYAFVYLMYGRPGRKSEVEKFAVSL